jgi:mRNA-degrading endonuclease RelE of RelBE toxin-antitoxin system
MKFEQLLTLFQEAHRELQKRAVRSVDIALVIRNWLFGWYIVEFEQGGADRAELYGKNLINRLSEELKNLGMKGVSSTNLKQCRIFYSSYREIGQALPDQSLGQGTGWQKIRQAMSGESPESLSDAVITLQALSAELASRFTLGWTHYVALLTISDDSYRLLQDDLAKNPQAGDLIPAGGGIRKLRFALPGRGKRGGARLIYYWQTSKDKIYLLLAYAKAKKENLELAQITILKALVKELERHG